MIWFNQSIQLTPEQLQAARDLWKEKGPRDYKLRYTKRLRADSSIDTFVVTVRGGVVVEATMNGNLLEKAKRPYHSMDMIYKDIERSMEQDSKPGRPRVFASAIFDNQNGALRRYIRKVMGTDERVELNLDPIEIGP